MSHFSRTGNGAPAGPVRQEQDSRATTGSQAP